MKKINKDDELSGADFIVPISFSAVALIIYGLIVGVSFTENYESCGPGCFTSKSPTGIVLTFLFWLGLTILLLTILALLIKSLQRKWAYLNVDK